MRRWVTSLGAATLAAAAACVVIPRQVYLARYPYQRFVPGTGWNAVLAGLARQHGADTFRVYNGDVPETIYPYTAFRSGYDVMMFSTHSGFAPRYHHSPSFHNLQDPEELARSLKIFRILNARYLLARPSMRDFASPQTRVVRRDGDLTLYELTSWLPRAWTPSRAALLIGKDQEYDWNGTEARLALFHPVFDPAQWAIFRSPVDMLDLLTVEDLQPFQAVLLARPRAWNREKVEALLDAYRAGGGRVIELAYSGYRYSQPGLVTHSITTDYFAAKRLSSDSRDQLAELFATPDVTPAPARVEIVAQEPSRWRFRVTTQAGVTPVVVSATYFPGWKATVNGRPATLYMADGIIRGLLVRGRGEHTVELRYQPVVFWQGLGITVVTIGLVVIVLRRPRSI
ncbi:MAG: hypothetical protein HY600_02110 [Candidatus Omnitrophica bacterium]|nr:hypothetical protein [Candidatus Omnitrophota bacterium]